MAKTLSLAVAAAALTSTVHAQYLNASNTTGYINYTTVTGYFLQDDASTNATGFDYVCHTLSAKSASTDHETRLPSTSA